MGVSNSRLEEDQGVELCRSRKKFIKEALNGRCSLASAHISYIQHLGILGSVLRGFIEHPDARAHVLPSSPTGLPSEKLDLVQKPIDRPSGLSKSPDEGGNMFPASSPQVTSSFQSNAMRFGGAVSTKVEEKLPVVAAAVASRGDDEVTPAWDYFGLFHHTDGLFDSQERMGFGSEDEMKQQLEEDEGMPELEEVGDRQSSRIMEEEESEDEFDEPPSASLVRTFRNVNTDSENVASESRFSGSDNVEETRPDITKKIKSPDGKKDNSSVSSPHRECGVEDTVLQPKDLFSSIGDIEQFFVEASESGKEVPRMLEATNKFHFRLVEERGLTTSWFPKSCFSCGKKDPKEVPQEVPQNTVNYFLTWHRTRSSCSSSSQNPPIQTNSTDPTNEQPNGNLFDNSCMVSGSHASTLDRLYAWETKLYDEVKAGRVLRANFDQKCKILQKKESRGESDERTRAAAKDLHSRIRVSIHRINSISKKIEEIRDSELQPQLEELIQGLRKMWEAMARCHKRQFHIVSVSHIPGATTIKTQPETILHLVNELNSLSATLTKWISAQKAYVEAIDRWLFKCVALPQNPTKRNKRMKPPPIRNCGPPIYMMCGAWLEMIDQLPVTGTVESLNALATEVARFTPTNQEKGKGKNGTNAAEEDDHRPTDLDPFRTALTGFLEQLDKFAGLCAERFLELQKGIGEAKWKYERFELQRGFRVVG